MLTLHRILHQGQIQVLLLLLFVVSCRKPDPVLPDPPANIIVEATVPALIYSNVKEVYLDASRSISLNGRRALFFTWTCSSFPAASGKPVIVDSNLAFARVYNPGVGQYTFKLIIKDNLGNMAESSYALDVREDTLTGKKPIAKAGQDQQIYAPKHSVILDAFETFSVNPMGRSLFFKWTLIQKPAAAIDVQIKNSTLPEAFVDRLVEGEYKIQLEVKNELGLLAYDTVNIKVLPDALKGTTRIFENELWEVYEDVAWGGNYVVVVIFEQDLFENRFDGNMEVRVWDEEKKEWSDPAKFEWYITEGGSLFIMYPYLDDEEAYFKMVGVKTRVQVKFL
jgi:hypothetical protein